MTEKELKKLHRSDLMELLLEQSKKVQELETKLEIAESELESRRIHMLEAGNIAEASLALNDVFSAAQAAAEQYLENIRENSKNQEEICRAMELKTKSKCDAVLAEAHAEADKILAEANAKRAEAEAYWNNLSGRLESFYKEHRGLRELLLYGDSDALGKDL